MPYKIVRRGEKYCVAKKEGEDWKVPSKGWCHATRKDALDHLKALVIHVPDAKATVENTDCNCGDFISSLTNKNDLNRDTIHSQVTEEATLSVQSDHASSDLQLLAKEKDMAINKSPAVIIKKRDVIYATQQGVVYFDKEADSRRDFKNSAYAFCSPLRRKSDGTIHFESKSSKIILPHMVIKNGEYSHPWFGSFNIGLDELLQAKANHDENILGQDISFNVSHMPFWGALGFTEYVDIREYATEIVEANGDRRKEDGYALWAFEELTPYGKREIVDDRKFRYTSAEWAFLHTDNEVFEKPNDEEEEDGDKDEDKDSDDEEKKQPKKYQVEHTNVLVGSAATNVPFIPRLQKFAASNDLSFAFKNLIDQFGTQKKAKEAIESEMKRRGLI